MNVRPAVGGQTRSVEFFCYHRDRPGSLPLREEPATARAILTPASYAATEVHSWQFGGRPS